MDKQLLDPTLGLDARMPLGRMIIQEIKRFFKQTYLKIFERRGRVLDTAQYTGCRTKQQQNRFK